MNAALLLSAILIMAPVTALINTITSQWKSLRKTLSCGCVPPTVYKEAVSYADGGAAGWMASLRGCDFVVHHCPCLMEAWLFLSSCCDNAKCCFHERAKRVPPPTVNTPPHPNLTNTNTGHCLSSVAVQDSPQHKQVEQDFMEDNICLCVLKCSPQWTKYKHIR